eukprot:8418323-Ditylum_brightwellii.AAC.1
MNLHTINAMCYVGGKIVKKEDILSAKQNLSGYDSLPLCQYCYHINIKVPTLRDRPNAARKKELEQ